MEIVYFVFGIVTAVIFFTVVGIVNVRTKIAKIESNTNDFDKRTNDIYQLIESNEFNMDRRIVDEMREVALRIDETNKSIENQINDIHRLIGDYTKETGMEFDEIRRWVDSRIDKLDSKFSKKEIING